MNRVDQTYRQDTVSRPSWSKMTWRLVVVTILIATAIAACAAPSPTTQVATRAGPTPTPNPAPCVLAPVIVSTRPAETPKYTELDPTTGLHMTGTAQEIDLASYRLKVTGKVDRPLGLTYDELRCMPKVKASPTLICRGYFEDVATWAGVPLEYVLDLAGVQAGATEMDLVGADGYSAYVPMKDARSGDNFLAYEWEGQPLPILHGFPVRAVFPALDGNKWVKWLVEIQVR